MKSILFSLCLFSSFAVFADPTIQIKASLKASSINAFLKQANDVNSAIGKRIAQINADSSDGRNQSGSIKLPITKDDLQVVQLTYEQMYNPWHYSSKSDSGETCTATGDSAEFLILLSSSTNVHGATDFQSINFDAKVEENLSAKRKDGGQIEFCQDVAEADEGTFVIAPTQVSVSEISEISITGPNSQN